MYAVAEDRKLSTLALAYEMKKEEEKANDSDDSEEEEEEGEDQPEAKETLTA